MEIVERDGYEALTLQRLAQSMGLVTTAMYRYFPSKDALSAALQRRAIEDAHVHFKAEQTAALRVWAGAAAPTVALAQLCLAAKLYLELPRAQPRAWLFIAILLGDPRPLLSDEHAAQARPVLATFLEEVEVSFSRAMETEAIGAGPTRPRMLAYWAAVHGALCLDKVRRIDSTLPTPIEVGMLAARGLLESWGASSARLTAAERLLLDVDGTSPKKGRAK